MCGCKFYEDEERQVVACDFTFMVEIFVLGSKLVSLAQPYIFGKNILLSKHFHPL